MPNLRFTDEQFDDGATADGNRIERALADLMARFNGLRQRDLRRRYLPVTVCGGYRPLTVPHADKFPWQPAVNLLADLTTPADVTNKYRSKGFAQPGIDLETAKGMQYAMEITLAFPDGGIIDGVSFQTPAYKYWPGAGTLPPGRATNTPADDLCIEVQIANPALPMNRRLSSQEVLKRNFNVNAGWIEFWAGAGPHTDGMKPVSSSTDRATFQTCCLEARALNIPVPIGHVARIVLTIPDYTGTGYGNAWGSTPWDNAFGWSAHLLKPLRD